MIYYIIHLKYQKLILYILFYYFEKNYNNVDFLIQHIQKYNILLLQYYLLNYIDYRLRNSNNNKAAAAIAAGTIAVGSSAGYKQVASGVTFTLDYPIMFNGTARAANAVNCTDLYYDRESVNL